MNVNPVPWQTALEETFFLGLRLNRGLDLESVEQKFGKAAIEEIADAIDECVKDGVLEKYENTIRLTSRGRLLSNEVFGRFIEVKT